MIKNYDIIFLCLAKNVQNTIIKLFEFHKKLKHENVNSLLVIGENNSNDKTVETIKIYSKKDIDIIYLDTSLINIYKNRIERLTHGRNFLKKYLKENHYLSKFISIVDVDDVINCNLDVENFIKLLKYLSENRNSLFGISAKSKPYYYDMLNLFIEDFYEKDVLKIQSNKSVFNSYYLRKKNIYRFQKKITEIKKDIKAISAHNGFCVYLYEDYMSGSYLTDQKKNLKKIVPEHIILNRSIHKKTKKYMLVSNNFFVKTPKEHMPYFSFSEFIKSKLLLFFLK